MSVDISETKVAETHVAKVSIQHFYISVDNFQRNQLIISRTNSGDEEQRSISSVDDFSIYGRDVGLSVPGTNIQKEFSHLCIPRSYTFLSDEPVPAGSHPSRSLPLLSVALSETISPDELCLYDIVSIV